MPRQVSRKEKVIRIWDQWIRIFHWSLVVAVGFSLISGETGLGFFDWHRLAGEIILVLVLFRVIWGFVGSDNARLVALIVNPTLALNHLRTLFRGTLTQERGHNHAGGWAVLFMLLLISVQAITGLFIADDEEWVEGALHGAVSSDLTDFLYNIHHTNAVVLQAVVVLHVVMIALYYSVGKQNLITPMITGMTQWTSSKHVPPVKFASFLLGLVMAVLSLVSVAFLVGWLG